MKLKASLCVFCLFFVACENNTEKVGSCTWVNENYGFDEIALQCNPEHTNCTMCYSQSQVMTCFNLNPKSCANYETR